MLNEYVEASLAYNWLNTCLKGAALDTEIALKDQKDNCDKDIFDEIVVNATTVMAIKRWLADKRGIEELAHILNEREKRHHQVFEQFMGGLVWKGDDEIRAGTDYLSEEEYEENVNLSKMVKGKDIF